MLIVYLTELRILKSHYTKAPSRQYTRETNENKLTLLIDLRNRFYQNLHRDFDQALVSVFDKDYDIVFDLINKQTNMSNFSIEIGQRLPTLTNQNGNAIRDFLNEIEATVSLLNNAGKEQCIRFVVGAKIRGVR